jgi:hypothetical protein
MLRRAAGIFHWLSSSRNVGIVRRVLSPLYEKSRQRILSVRINDKIFWTKEGNNGKCEMDSHADTCVAGKNFLMCEFNGTTCEV